MADCDRCVHLASAVGVQLVVAHPLETLRRIVHGADVVISAAARQAERLLFMSTSEVYGKSSNGPLREDSDQVLGSALKSRWSYAIAKSYGEAIASGYHREHGADATVARLFNTIGPRQVGAHGMVVPRLVRQAIAGDDLTVFGDGSQTRCFLHVADAVSAIVALTEHDRSGRARIQHRRPGVDHDRRTRHADHRARGLQFARSRSCPTTRPMTMASRSSDSARPTSRLSRISPVGDREARSIKRSTT